MAKDNLLVGRRRSGALKDYPSVGLRCFVVVKDNLLVGLRCFGVLKDYPPAGRRRSGALKDYRPVVERCFGVSKDNLLGGLRCLRVPKDYLLGPLQIGVGRGENPFRSVGLVCIWNPLQQPARAIMAS